MTREKAQTPWIESDCVGAYSFLKAQVLGKLSLKIIENK